MALKEWCQHLRPIQLYIMLTLTVLFFTAELAISHFTHSLTLLMDSYQMLCNIITLSGCLITIKKLNTEDEQKPRKVSRTNDSAHKEVETSKESLEVERDFLKNTFGWARIDILVMMIGCVFLASLCFSLLVEALQTLVHIGHQHEMHYPLIILVVASVGVILNGVCYLLIGGYTFHQGSYFRVTASGDVVLDRWVTQDSLRQGQRRLSAQTRKPAMDSSPSPPPQRQGVREMLRDVIGSVYVILCASLVFLTSGHDFAKYIDPVISVASAVTILALSYPYMKESGLILLQTIPNDINIDLLLKELIQTFPDIVNVHDFHVWQLTADKVFATAHIVFLNPKDYVRIDRSLSDFFTQKGITQATIQAEFVPPGVEKSAQLQCLMPCLTFDCRFRNCCVEDENTLEKVEVVKLKTEETLAVSELPS